MNRLNAIKGFYLIGCILSLINGGWMLLFPLSWYNDFPADISHTGAFNSHFVRDLGIAFLIVGVAFAWAARNVKRSYAVHVALTLFFTGHALIHFVDTVTGLLPSSHWLTDLPGVFAPALIMVALSIPSIRQRVSLHKN